MKYDMSGGAGVIAAMGAIAQLKPKINVIGLVPATENLPGGKATKPGDIVKAMNGKTIEVINTDAEGRLILADALCYARNSARRESSTPRRSPARASSRSGTPQPARSPTTTLSSTQFLAVANDNGERYWQMPLLRRLLKEGEERHRRSEEFTGGRAAGTLTAAAFLKHSSDDTPWMHLDIAGTAYVDEEKPCGIQRARPARRCARSSPSSKRSPAATTHATMRKQTARINARGVVDERGVARFGILAGEAPSTSRYAGDDRA